MDKHDVEEKLGNDYEDYRITIRTVASSTNKRALIATVLPPYATSVHNLWSQRHPQKMDIAQKLFIVGIINSYTLDFYLRQLVEKNISKFFLKQLPIPRIEDIKDADNIIQIVKELLKKNEGFYTDLDTLIPGNNYSNYNENALLAELDARIMLDYGITRQEVVTILESFKSKKHTKDVEEDEQRILDKYDQLTGGAK